MCSPFLLNQISTTETQITALNVAITDISSGAIESYTLDTGQTRQTVTKSSLQLLHKVIDSLLNRLTTLEARCGNRNAGTILARPAF